MERQQLMKCTTVKMNDGSSENKAQRNFNNYKVEQNNGMSRYHETSQSSTTISSIIIVRRVNYSKCDSKSRKFFYKMDPRYFAQQWEKYDKFLRSLMSTFAETLPHPRNMVNVRWIWSKVTLGKHVFKSKTGLPDLIRMFATHFMFGHVRFNSRLVHLKWKMPKLCAELQFLHRYLKCT